MMNFSKLVLFLSLSFLCVFGYAQTTKGGKTNSKQKTTATKSNTKDKSSSKTTAKKGKKFSSSEDGVVETPAAPEGSADNGKSAAKTTAKSDTGKALKDPQNQTQFMKPDMDAQKYNFYQRKGVSTPLMMRYDLDSAAYQKGGKKGKQQQAYKNNQYYFPAKPRDMWELGVNFGSAFISGDVKPYVAPIGLIQNIGVGGTIRKSIGYVASVRLGYNYMMTTGRNWEPDANLEFNPALTGKYDSRVNYWNNPVLDQANTSEHITMNKLFFYNYRTYIHTANVEAVFNIGNILFHKERPKVNLYLFVGASAMFFTTYMDALNANGQVYDFSNVMVLYTNNGNPANTVNSRDNLRKTALSRLDNILDGKYETHAEHENNAIGIKDWQFIPAGTVGAGVQFHVSKWVTLGLEERIILTGSDLLDGYRWQQDEHSGFTTNYDNISYTSINLFFHVGTKKQVEPLWWLNPIHHTYKKLSDMDPDALKADILKDDDDDGVPNYLDKEPNSKKGCPVDTHGVMLDSDHDGIPDCDDKEPFSPPGYPIDSTGKAIIPPNPCCDTSGFSSENGPNGPGGENPNGGPGGPGAHGRHGNGNYDCAKIELPAVVFDEDKYYLDPQYFGNLHQIAERMQMCPDMKLVVTGYGYQRSDQKYNEQLGWNRANAAVDYLVEKYGISRDRFIIKYEGGKKAAEGTPYERKMKNKVEFRYANDGETGDSNPPSPHPGLKAGSNK